LRKVARRAESGGGGIEVMVEGVVKGIRVRREG